MILLVVATVVIVSTMRSCSDLANEAQATKERQRIEAQNAEEKRQQTEAFNKHREQVLAIARAALAADDLDSVEKVIAPLDKVSDPALTEIRNAIAEKRRAAAAAKEKASLVEQAKHLEPGDSVNGLRIYQRLAALEPENSLYASKAKAFAATREKERAAAEALAKKLLRQKAATAMEESFLKRGQDATVTAVGKDKTTLRIEYVLVGKAFAYQVSHEAEFIANCRKLGFKKIVLADGYNETWTMDL